MTRADIDLTDGARLPGVHAAEELLRLEISAAGVKEALRTVVGLSAEEADAVVQHLLRRMADSPGPDRRRD